MNNNTKVTLTCYSASSSIRKLILSVPSVIVSTGVLLLFNGCFTAVTHITSDPSGATVTVDNKYRGETPLLVRVSDEFTFVQYITYQASLEGYEPQSKVFKATGFEHVTDVLPPEIHFKLKPKSFSETRVTDSPWGALKVVNYRYDNNTHKGSLSVDITGRGIEVREWVLKNIGKICSTKELLLQAGEENSKGGRYRVLNETVKDGVLTIEFSAGFD